MLKIFLCDDDPFFLALENDIINRIIRTERLDAVVAGKASSAAEVILFLRANPGDYLLFLDIDFGENLPNGLDISAAIKNENIRAHIVFTTNHCEMAMSVLKSGAEPFGFVEKGTDIKRLTAEFRQYICMAVGMKRGDEDRQDIIRLAVGSGEEVEICKSGILYLEAEKNISHGITYHTVNNSKITIIGTLDAEGKRLGTGFLRIHRSYIAAKAHILGLKNGYLILSDRSEIPCSFRMRSEVKKWLGKK